MICFFCDKEIEGAYKLIALERPYGNLYFHPKHQILKDYDKLELFLKENMKKVYNYVGETNNNGRK